MNRRAVVIGAGVSGCSSALILAANGFDVTLVEKSPHVAPLIRGFNFAGLRVETGFHYTGGLGPGGSLSRLLEYLGIFGRISTRQLDPDGTDLVEEDGMEPFAFPAGVDHLRERLANAFPAEREGIDAYLAAVKGICDSFAFLNPYAAPAAANHSPFGPWGEKNLSQFFDEHITDPRLRRLLAVHRALYGADTHEVPFAVHAAVVGAYYDSAWVIEGGGLALALAFEAELAARGVRVLCGHEVTKVEVTQGGAVRGVRLGGGEALECESMLYSGHPKSLLEMVPKGAFRPAYRKRVASLEESESALMLAASCCAVDPKLMRSNLYLLSDEKAKGDGFDPEGQFLYVTPLWKSSGAMELGGFLILTHAPFAGFERWADSSRIRRPEEYLEFKDRAARNLLQRLERSYPHMVGKVDRIKAATPLTFRDYTGSPRGGLYGIKRRVGQFNPIPPTHISGLFLTGQSVALPGLMGSTVSAFITAGYLVRNDRILSELRRMG